MPDTFYKIIELMKTQNIVSANINSPNILYMLGVHYNEVITCRLIKAIIEPNGFHGLGDEPLLMFFKMVLGKDNIKELKNAEIILEEPITDNRRVDIAIYNDGCVYPIEVKIWAKDQNNQLYDYYNYYDSQKENCKIDKIYYLTPNGHPPSKASRNDLPDEKIERKSFSKDIKRYLTALKPLVKGVDNEEFRIVVNNFSEVINVMCSIYNNQEKFMDVFRELQNATDKNNFLSLIKQKDELWEKIRRDFIFKSLDKYAEDNGIKIDHNDFENAAKFVDPKCLYEIEYNNQKAYICIDTNLYIIRQFDNGVPEGWNDYNNNKYPCYAWSYIKKDGEEWDLKHIDDNLYSQTINWELYL